MISLPLSGRGLFFFSSVVSSSSSSSSSPLLLPLLSFSASSPFLRFSFPPLLFLYFVSLLGSEAREARGGLEGVTCLRRPSPRGSLRGAREGSWGARGALAAAAARRRARRRRRRPEALGHGGSPLALRAGPPSAVGGSTRTRRVTRSSSRAWRARRDAAPRGGPLRRASPAPSPLPPRPPRARRPAAGAPAPAPPRAAGSKAPPPRVPAGPPPATLAVMAPSAC